MHISGIKIEGFHSLQNVSLTFNPGLNVLVGKNNSGKSNIIKAIDYILGEKWPTYIDIEDRAFYKDASGKRASHFSILVGLSGKGIDDSLLEAPSKKLKIVKTTQGPNLDKFREWVETVNAQSSLSPWPTYKDVITLLKSADRTYFYFYVPKVGKRSEREYSLIFKSNNAWYYCNSFSSEIRDALLTTAYIPAFRDPSQQLRVNQYSWYGKLVKGLYEARDDTQRAKITKAQKSQTKILNAIFRNATSQLRKKLARAVFHHKVTFHPGANTTDDEFKQIMMFVDDGIDSPYYEKGSGIQSALIIGLYSFYCEQFHKGSSLLLVEEPEIYLHPQARRAIEGQLTEFIRDGADINSGMHKHQVIISTHSPEFLRSAQPADISLVRKRSGTTSTYINRASQSTTHSSQIFETKNAEMFFADHVVLVEGGEEYIIPPLADIVTGKKEFRWLDVKNISIARVNGKAQFKTYTEILEDFGISWTILTDLDFLIDGIDPFVGRLSKDGRDALSRVVQNWKTLLQNQTLSGKEIRNKVFNPGNRDWRLLYEKVSKALGKRKPLTTTEKKELSALWKKLSDRVGHKVDYAELYNLSKDDVGLVLAELKSHEIFVLPNGELEDHLPDSALKDINKSGKDRNALEFGQALRNSDEMAVKWVKSKDARPFVELIKHLKKKSS